MNIIILSLNENDPLYNLLLSFNLNVKLFKGYRKNEVEEDFLDYFEKNNYMGDGAIGCAYSHLKILNYITTLNISNDDRVLILEQDAFFPNGVFESIIHLERLFNEIKELEEIFNVDCDIFYPGYNCFLLNSNKLLSNNISMSTGFIFGLHSYCPTKKACFKILNLFKQNKVTNHLDLCLAQFTRNKQLYCFLINKEARFISQTSGEVKIKLNKIKAESTNIINYHPIIITSILSNIESDKQITLAYSMCSSLRKVTNYNITMILVIQCIIGFFLGFFKFRYITIVLLWTLIYLWDFLYTSPNIDQIAFEFFLLSAFWLLGSMFY